MKSKYLSWKMSSWAVALGLMIPIIAVVYTGIGDSQSLFSHLFSTVLPHYSLNSLLLILGCMLLSFVFGVPSAWLMSSCHLPGKRALQWLLVLPLAMPGYIVGYIYTDWFDFAGPIQRWIRATFELQPQDYWFPDIRTLTGAIIILSLVLYPYVYLLARTAFMEQSASLQQSARLLNCTPLKTFFRVSLPLARPAIVVGLSLVAMEALGDFGTVSYFAVNTLTTAVYDTWLGYSNLTASAQIASMMLTLVICVLVMERYSRRKQKQFQSSENYQDKTLYTLVGWKKYLALIWCWGLVLAGFLLPLAQLILYSYHYWLESWTEAFALYVGNSLLLSFCVALLCVLVALIVNFSARIQLHGSHKHSAFAIAPVRLSSMGYAVPGTILAIGIMASLLTLDHGVNRVAIWLDWPRPGLIFSGTMVALIFALTVRFAAVAVGTIESHLTKISPSIDMAAKTMGCNNFQMLKRVHFPLISRGALIAGLLVFIESMKELNASILLRPFNFETLATHVYNYVSDQQLELAAVPAILLILVGLIPLVFANRTLEQGK